MLRIRLHRAGKPVKGRHNFKIVVMERRKARDSNFVEEIGYYSPKEELLKINIEKYQDWLKKGAKPTETVISLYKRYKKLLIEKK
ncbi:MAG: 30S ribosomal protein S16 [Candidatus Omnitrophica bacterium]|nr:30S ribosomal protein S16 [Candidatus Omnitrophota bacterium]MCM8830831.1 30S ribosomal protein S16 [Candidatus Omnitrophota bacterium]